MFGGTQPDKAATSARPNVRQEKQEALKLLSQEIRRLDAEEMQVQLGAEVDRTILKIQKE